VCYYFQYSNFLNSIALFEAVNDPLVATLYKKTSIESTEIDTCDCTIGQILMTGGKPVLLSLVHHVS
jgi:hypothetical protein